MWGVTDEIMSLREWWRFLRRTWEQSAEAQVEWPRVVTGCQLRRLHGDGWVAVSSWELVWFLPAVLSFRMSRERDANYTNDPAIALQSPSDSHHRREVHGNSKHWSTCLGEEERLGVRWHTGRKWRDKKHPHWVLTVPSHVHSLINLTLHMKKQRFGDVRCRVWWGTK